MQKAIAAHLWASEPTRAEIFSPTFVVFFSDFSITFIPFLSNFLSVFLNLYWGMFLILRFAFFIIRIEYTCVQFSDKNIHIVVPRNIPYFIYCLMNSACSLTFSYKQGFVSLNSTVITSLFPFSRTAKSPAFTSKLYPFSLFCICLNLDSYAHIIIFHHFVALLK